MHHLPDQIDLITLRLAFDKKGTRRPETVLNTNTNGALE